MEPPGLSKVIIIGGSSEIGNAIADEIKKQHSRYQDILKVSTSLSSKDIINWNPNTLEGVKSGLNQINPTSGDIAIIALGSLGNLEKTSDEYNSIDNLAEIYNVNLIVPALAANYLIHKFDSLGGGTVILLSSTAAFPVLDNNFIYGSAKRGLDEYVRYLKRTSKQRKTQICIVRSGFVFTKLNKGRSATPFSRTTDQVARMVVSQLNKDVIWTPKIFKYISFLLTRIPVLKLLAGKIVEKSKK